MLILLWKVNHRYHPEPIELCGQYKSLEHFYRVRSLDEWRGWILCSEVKVLKVLN